MWIFFNSKYYITKWYAVGWIQGCSTSDIEGQVYGGLIIRRFWTAWRFSAPNPGVAQWSTVFCNKRKISYFLKLHVGSLDIIVPVSLALKPKATYTLAHSSLFSLFVLIFLAVYHFRYLWWISNDSILLFTCNLIPSLYVKLIVNVRYLDKIYMFPIKTLLPICFGM